jgi:hypothetical protein
MTLLIEESDLRGTTRASALGYLVRPLQGLDQKRLAAFPRAPRPDISLRPLPSRLILRSGPILFSNLLNFEPRSRKVA